MHAHILTKELDSEYHNNVTEIEKINGILHVVDNHGRSTYEKGSVKLVTEE